MFPIFEDTCRLETTDKKPVSKLAINLVASCGRDLVLALAVLGEPSWAWVK